MTRAGAFDGIHGFALSLAGAIRARNGDLPGALAVLQEATVQLAGDGNRLGIGMTLERAGAVLARLGEAEPLGAGRSRLGAFRVVGCRNLPR